VAEAPNAFIRSALVDQIIWRGMSIGRIRRASGLPHDQPQWSWSCYLQGRPKSAIDNGNGTGLEACTAKFRTAWSRIRAGRTDQITTAHRYAENSASSLARYDARGAVIETTNRCQPRIRT
jgi:hypothetical protein